MQNTIVNTQSVQHDVVNIITRVTRINPNRLLQVQDLSKLGLDLIDVVDIILQLEKTYRITIPDDVPVYRVDDLVNYVHSHTLKQAG
ncbi:acyl carrier protein [Pontibacter mangrovi]|uniref:Acyl carrier protein n=1 Tax=Pontibacter mangrovi TaxID=2589816 RepID=A0A501W315_9BACT|nr:acyl carrier protein [Pontibacter mangrovi]TPE43025.1 acyl carrier protein [Pontibacter mangrovi]